MLCIVRTLKLNGLLHTGLPRMASWNWKVRSAFAAGVDAED